MPANPKGKPSLFSRVTGKYRQRVHIPRQGWLFLLITLFVGVAAIHTQVNLLFLIFGLLCGAVVASGIFSTIGIRPVHVKRLLPKEIQAGNPACLTYRVTNKSPCFSAYALRIEERLTRSKRTHTPATRPPLGLALRLPPRQTRDVHAALLAFKRGPLDLTGLRLSTRFPFGLFEKYRLFHQPANLLVLPAIGTLHADPFAALQARASSLTRHATARPGRDEFYAIRDYRHGDNPRWIHWKSSARLGKLAVREMTQPALLRFIIVLDLRYRARDDLARQRCEQAISFAATLADHGLRANLNVGSVILASRIAVIAPSTGRQQRDRVLAALADANPQPRPPARPLPPLDGLPIRAIRDAHCLVLTTQPAPDTAREIDRYEALTRSATVYQIGTDAADAVFVPPPWMLPRQQPGGPA